MMESKGKNELYSIIGRKVEAVILGETNLIANLGNCSSILHETLGTLWTGFYLPEGDQLILGPFQGPVACTRIAFGKGVCGTAWKEGKTLVVQDVDLFPGHIACSPDSRSEIVVPGFVNGELKFMLDIDSTEKGYFNEVDKYHLERIINILLNDKTQG
jgi:GAF domain-containing protein